MRARPSRLESLTNANPIINRCFNLPHPTPAAIHNGQRPERPRREPGARLPLPSARIDNQSVLPRQAETDWMPCKQGARRMCAERIGQAPRPSHLGKRAAGSETIGASGSGVSTEPNADGIKKKLRSWRLERSQTDAIAGTTTLPKIARHDWPPASQKLQTLHFGDRALSRPNTHLRRYHVVQTSSYPSVTSIFKA